MDLNPDHMGNLVRSCSASSAASPPSDPAPHAAPPLFVFFSNAAPPPVRSRSSWFTFARLTLLKRRRHTRRQSMVTEISGEEGEGVAVQIWAKRRRVSSVEEATTLGGGGGGFNGRKGRRKGRGRVKEEAKK
ncbi:hypothetical protein SOVF_141910 [Spinacia oleracea]|nr:hypothetical protein SOVF_141910 [Spinacia oleracea]